MTWMREDEFYKSFVILFPSHFYLHEATYIFKKNLKRAPQSKVFPLRDDKQVLQIVRQLQTVIFSKTEQSLFCSFL